MNDDDIVSAAECNVEIIGQCTCGRDVGHQVDDKGQSVAVTHALPQCLNFKKREAHEFIHWLYQQKIQ